MRVLESLRTGTTKFILGLMLIGGSAEAQQIAQPIAQLNPQQKQHLFSTVDKLIDNVFSRIITEFDQETDHLLQVKTQLKSMRITPTHLSILTFLDSAEGHTLQLIYNDRLNAINRFEPAESWIRFSRAGTPLETLYKLLHEADHARRFFLQDPAVIYRFTQGIDNIHLEVLDEVSAWWNALGGTSDKISEAFTRAGYLPDGRINYRVTELIEVLQIADLTDDQKFRVFENLVDAFPQSSIRDAAGRLLASAQSIVTATTNTFANLCGGRSLGACFRIPFDDLILPKHALKVKAVMSVLGRTGAKALPIIGMGAGIAMFAVKVNEAEHVIEYADASFELVGCIPVIGDFIDVGRGVMEVILETTDADVFVAQLFFDTGDNLDDLMIQHREKVKAIREAKRAEKLLKAADKGEIEADAAEEEIEEMTYVVQIVGEKSLYEEGEYSEAKVYVEKQKQRKETLAIIATHSEPAVQGYPYVLVGDGVMDHELSLSQLPSLGLTQVQVETACFGVIGITTTGHGLCDISEPDLNLSHDNGRLSIFSSGSNDTAICLGMALNDGGPCDPDGSESVGSAWYDNTPELNLMSICAGELRDDGRACDPDGVPNSGNSAVNGQGAGVTFTTSCNGEVLDNGGRCDLDGIPGSSNGAISPETNPLEYATRFCQGVVTDNGSGCDPDGIANSGNHMDLVDSNGNSVIQICSGAITDNGGVCDPGIKDDNNGADYEIKNPATWPRIICGGETTNDGGFCDPDGEADDNDDNPTQPPVPAQEICVQGAPRSGGVCEPEGL